MSIDERIQSAGSRLASTPVAVPDLERLMRRRSRRVLNRLHSKLLKQRNSNRLACKCSTRSQQLLDSIN